MDRSSSKRKRTITACRECHRRKQKCDRARPCNNCIARNVQDRCSYGNPTAFELVRTPQKEDARLLEFQNEVDVEQLSWSLDLQSQAGYSSVHDSNAFTGLQESLHGRNTVSPTSSESLLQVHLNGFSI
ncbi:hypothetical protein V1508DRAFT_287342 [Lipomyces doorenjongii]|uniref:uncharacterized protein n=1 Tax=Lipomyces doorenjongii TaxID=383834 RepID=UPI0034CFDAED